MSSTQFTRRVREAFISIVCDSKMAKADDGLHHVELELTGLCRHGDREVVADHLEGDLVDDLGDDRVDLAGHDARAGLHRPGRLISLSPHRGPDESSRRSLQILESLTARPV
jgi:hypothetical protein